MTVDVEAQLAREVARLRAWVRALTRAGGHELGDRIVAGELGERGWPSADDLAPVGHGARRTGGAGGAGDELRRALWKGTAR